MTQIAEKVGSRRVVHPVDEVLPPQKLVVLGLQHLFIMYAGAIAVPIIVGGALGLDQGSIAILVSADLLVSGICTLIQAVGNILDDFYDDQAIREQAQRILNIASSPS